MVQTPLIPTAATIKKTIVGTITDSYGTPLTGTLFILARGTAIDTTTTPDIVRYPVTKQITITNGVIQLSAGVPLELVANDEWTYNFRFEYNVPRIRYFLVQTGEEYTDTQNVHQWTDSKWYTGVAHTSVSKELSRVTVQDPFVLFDFDAFINTTHTGNYEWSFFVETGVSVKNIDSTAYYIGRVLQSDPAFLSSIANTVFNPRGNYSAAATYKFGDFTFYAVGAGGGSWVWINPIPGNSTPADGTDWQALIKVSETGGGGGGGLELITTAFNTWNGVVDKAAPPDPIFDQIMLRAPLENPVFTGNNVRVPDVAGGASNTDRAMNARSVTAYIQSAISAIPPPVLYTVPRPLGFARCTNQITLTNNAVSPIIYNQQVIDTGDVLNANGEFFVPAGGGDYLFFSALIAEYCGNYSAIGERVKLRMIMFQNNVEVGDLDRYNSNTRAGCYDFGIGGFYYSPNPSPGDRFQIRVLPNMDNFVSSKIVQSSVNNFMFVWRLL